MEIISVQKAKGKRDGVSKSTSFCPKEETVSPVEKQAKGEKAVKPFLKWAGGKGQLLGEIGRYYPFSDEQIAKYAEPFVGGGAVLFDVLNKFSPQQVYISDRNPELINTYLAIRDTPGLLIEQLSLLQREFLPLDTGERKRYYTEKRAVFNRLKMADGGLGNVEKAALMIFLNRTCFNGLFRVNQKGLFNVPMGAYRNPLICDETNLRAASEKLQRVSIVCGDYRESADFIDAHTFVYLDPPYRPLTSTANFTAYTQTPFSDSDQRDLMAFVSEMDRKGAKILVSNSDPKNSDPEDDFFDSLYSTYHIARVQAARMINSNSKARGKIRELLIANFQPMSKEEPQGEPDAPSRR